MPSCFLGTWTGTRFFRAASAERFYATLELILPAAALALMGRDVAQVN